jgi:hypothetical protein
MPRTRSSILVQFSHGLESGPQGTKVQQLRQAGFAVQAPDMQMSLKRLERRNSMPRQLLRLPETRGVALATAAALGLAYGRGSRELALGSLGLLVGWGISRRGALIEQALDASFEACLEVQRRGLRERRPDVLLGSSWGGAVALELIRRGHWDGPTVLLAPAYRRVAFGAGWPDLMWRERQLRALCQRLPVVVFHDPSDDTVPLQDNTAFLENTDVELRLVSAGGHRLLGLLEDGSLYTTLDEIAER